MFKVKHFLSLLIVVLVATACSSAASTAAPTSVALPTLPPATVPVTVIVEPTLAPQSSLPQDDAAVPRVPVDQAKAAFDSGDAIIVDVRGPSSFARGHIAGALEISVSAIVTDPSNLPLDKNKWIITYCT